MLFTSPAFLFGFLPIFLIAFMLVSRSARLTLAARLIIIFGTYIFYGFENVGYLIPFLFATCMDLIWGRLLESVQQERLRKLIVAASVVQNIGLLAIFKYLNWIAASLPHSEIIQAIHKSFSSDSGLIELPPGISFYLFESLSFVIDCYRRKIRFPKNPFNFLTFITMFPRFIAGPIVRYSDLEESIVNYKGMKIANGFFVFVVGFNIKILLADSFEKIVTPNFGAVKNFWTAWLSALSYTFQIYLDFSAYSLMAIGLGMIIGFPFIDNFREPYLSRNITEFWRKWHISLSTWLRDYLYIPLGGNRGSEGRTYRNLMLTMLLGGLWHGANITFVIWGAYHGMLLAVERMLKKKGVEIHSRFLTFTLVLIGWVYFRADRASMGARMINSMIGLNGWGWNQTLRIVAINAPYISLGVVGIAWVFFIEPWVREQRGNRDWHAIEVRNVPWLILGVTVVSFGFALLLALADRNIPFLYFQF